MFPVTRVGCGLHDRMLKRQLGSMAEGQGQASRLCAKCLAEGAGLGKNEMSGGRIRTVRIEQVGSERRR